MTEDSEFVFYPFNELLATPTLQQYLNKFAYFRSDLHLKILSVTSPMQYGITAVSFLPSLTDNSKWSSLVQKSQSDMVLLDMSSQQALELDLEFLDPRSFVSKDDPGRTWRVVLTNLSLSTITLGAPVSYTVQVFASFINPKASGFIADFQAVVRPNRQQGMDTFVQSAAAVGLAGYSMGGVRDMISTASKAYESIKKTFTSEKAKEEKEVQDCKLSLAPDLPMGGFKPGLYLGDPQVVHVFGSISSLMSKPTYTGKVVLVDDTPVSLATNPFLLPTHLAYLSKVFKFFSGSVRLLVKFVTPPMISGRVRLTVVPVQDPTLDFVDPVGDLLSTVITVRESSEHVMELPFLYQYDWAPTDAYVPPGVLLALEGPLPQPYDKPTALVAHTFLSCPTARLRGLQSFVPGQFQCFVRQRMERIDTNYSVDFKRDDSFGDSFSTLISRFSSRTPDLSSIVPAPIELTEENQYDYDNFDYLCQLYRFFTGGLKMRMLFNSAVESGILHLSVSNSKQEPTGQSFKAGNSLILADQTVWPMLNLDFPYMSIAPFQTVVDPEPGLYTVVSDNTAELGEFLVAPSSDFRLEYEMPVPDFFVASFQSLVRFNGHKTYRANYYQVGAITGQRILEAHFDASPMICWEIEISYYATSTGPYSFQWAVGGPGPNMSLPANDELQTDTYYCSGLQRLVAPSIVTISKAFVTANGPTDMALTLYIDKNSPANENVYVTLRLSPWTGVQVLSDPNQQLLIGSCQVQGPEQPLYPMWSMPQKRTV